MAPSISFAALALAGIALVGCVDTPGAVYDYSYASGPYYAPAPYPYYYGFGPSIGLRYRSWHHDGGSHHRDHGGSHHYGGGHHRR